LSRTARVEQQQQQQQQQEQSRQHQPPPHLCHRKQSDTRTTSCATGRDTGFALAALLRITLSAPNADNAAAEDQRTASRSRLRSASSARYAAAPAAGRQQHNEKKNKHLCTAPPSPMP
jgi:hypothetical protein